MTRPAFLLRADNLFWSRTGWQPSRDAAERYPSLRLARAARADLAAESDREVVVVRSVAAGRRRPCAG